ncbi:uncharacterized protein PAC_06203 [Phialocephala subalpina]|uniref:DUF1993 domain protein n=1 Tax=Phialocephala subalpina TaxID=576137 RepID=A0A1L7WU54_9HELO|nr:uncharacterized protein PAC_06203 [Phialocephala subalpina]
MPLSLYEISAIPFISCLENLSKILDKAQAHVSSTSVEESTLTTSSLITDMRDFAFQIQRLCDMAKCLAVYVAQTEPIRREDNPTTLAEMQERIAKTIAVLKALDPKPVNNKEDKEVVMTIPSGEMKCSTGTSYVLTFLVPNFFFHYCMAYALLRKEGVPLGKGDYLGRV